MIDKQKAVHVCNMYNLMSLEIHTLLRNHHHSSCQTYPSSLEGSSSQCPPKEEGNRGETACTLLYPRIRDEMVGAVDVMGRRGAVAVTVSRH